MYIKVGLEVHIRTALSYIFQHSKIPAKYKTIVKLQNRI